MRHCRALLIATAVMLALAADARAETGACPVLEARLAALDRSADDYWDSSHRATNAAIDRARAELEQAMSAARREGCYGSALSTGREAGNTCTALTARADGIRTELETLQDAWRAVADDPYGAERQRSQLVADLVASGCGDRAAFERGGRRRTGVLAIIGGRHSYRGSSPGIGYGGTYRTLCVRTCDGYFFPISFAASAGAFSRDEGACRARCPGSDVALYVHRNPGEDETRMMSLAGEPYTALPTAFRYRKEYDPACTCPSVTADPGQPVPPTATVMTGPPLVVEARGGVLTIAPAAPSEQPMQPKPMPRRGGTTDPETADNRAGSFTPAAPAIPTIVGTTAGKAGNGTIRVVGPAGPFTAEAPADTSLFGTPRH